jgi:hypothetical protein
MTGLNIYQEEMNSQVFFTINLGRKSNLRRPRLIGMISLPPGLVGSLNPEI